MRQKSFLFILVFLLYVVFGQAQKPTYNTQEDERLIRETIQLYFDGWMTGDTTKVGKAMHPTCHLKFMRGDKFEMRNRNKYLSGFKPRPKETSESGNILKLNITNNVASAKCRIETANRVFTDYFNLMKVNQRWYIMDKIATNKAKGESNLTEDKKAALDKIFSEFEDPTKPGVAAAVLHKDEVIYQKTFGVANIEHQSPITSTTKFQIDAMSKHFTAFTILLLEEQGKLSLQDDARKYIKELPDYGKKITLEHLLTHTSGLREYWTTKWLSGSKYDDVFTKKEVLKMATSLKTLNHVPGEQYSFNSMNMSLLAEVVTRITGQSFADFTKKNIFEPLGMNHTQFLDDHTKVITNKATPYKLEEGNYKIGTTNNVDVGAIGLYTCIEDLVTWEQNFKSPKVGSRSTWQKLNQPIRFKNGLSTKTSRGDLTYGQQFIHPERGIEKIYQTGDVQGYVSSIFKFPEQEYTAIVLNNAMEYNGHLGMQSVNVFMEELYTLPDNIGIDDLDVKKLSAKQLSAFEGYYWDENDSYSRRVYLKNDTLRYQRENYGSESLLIPIGDNKFQMLHGGDENIWIEFKKKGNQQILHGHINDYEYTLRFYDKKSYSPKELEQYKGTYMNEELDVVFHLVVKEDQLVLTSLHHDDMVYHATKPDFFWSHNWYFGGILFERDSNKNITGFQLSQQVTKNLPFKKIN